MVWLKILIFILQLIAEGMSKGKAAEVASSKFGVSAASILRKL